MRNRKTCFLTGVTFIALFAFLTLLIMTIDVRPVGQNGTNIGFATLNTGFHALTGANMTLYTIIFWLGLLGEYADVLRDCPTVDMQLRKAGSRAHEYENGTFIVLLWGR